MLAAQFIFRSTAFKLDTFNKGKEGEREGGRVRNPRRDGNTRVEKSKERVRRKKEGEVWA